MKRIAPSERVRKQIEDLLEGNAASNQSRDEKEQASFLGRERYEHQAEGCGWRNGHEPKTLRTSVGKVPVDVPQTRGTAEPFRSRLLDELGGRTGTLERLASEMYARGLSTRDIAEAFVSATGEQLLSRSVVSEVTESLQPESEAFQQRDLSGYDLECLFLDAIYEALRLRAGIKEAVLCAWGILRDGRKVLLHMALGNKESYDAWLEMLRNMVSRGLKVLLSITADGAPGLIKAIDQVYPQSLRIRCWVHKMRNIRAKLPRDVAPGVEAETYTIRDAATLEQGRARMQEVTAKYRGLYPRRWVRIKFSPVELEQLDTLRRTLGLADRKTESGPQTTGQKASA